MNDLQAVLLAIVICAYWSYVGALAVRVRRRTRKLAGIVPSQPLEQAMWLLWVPLVRARRLLPGLATQRSDGPWALPAFARETPYALLRWAGAGLALLCLQFIAEMSLVATRRADPFGMAPEAKP